MITLSCDDVTKLIYPKRVCVNKLPNVKLLLSELNDSKIQKKLFTKNFPSQIQRKKI